MLRVAALILHISASYSVRPASDNPDGTLSTGFLQTRLQRKQIAGDALVDAGKNEAVPINDKPKGDPRKYQGAVLANGLHVINIQDESSLDSAMAMGVMSGLYNDPPDLPGLAHFCEHMLFLGSAKFPSATEFDQYMSMHGGSNNAFTATELTDYFFQSSKSSALDAMPRFADWFVEPMFNRTYVEKEVHAIDSEHAKNRDDPTWRILDLFHSLANPESPVSRFHTGNIDTLLTEPKKKGIDTVAELRKYFNEHYCASKMRLVTFGATSLSEQFAAAKKAFSNISLGSESCRQPNSYAVPAAWPADRLGKWVNVLGTQPTSELWLMFPMPDLTSAYASRPEHYLDYVFQYKGLNSLSRVLETSLGLTSGMSTMLEGTGSAGGHFFIILDLSPAGRAQHSLVLDLVFSYIAALRRAGANEKLYESLADLSKLNWDWAGLSTPMDTVSNFAQTIAEMPMQDSIWGGARIDVVNVTLINSLFETLRPDNMIAASVVPAKTSVDMLFDKQQVQTLPNYGVKYSVQPIESQLLGRAATWQKWITGKATADEVRSEILTTLKSTNLPSVEVLPTPPRPIIGVPKHMSLDHMHAQNLAGEAGAGSTESIFGPLPTRLSPDSQKGREIWYRRGWMTNAPQVQLSVSLRRMRHEGDPEPSAQEVVEYALYAKLLNDKMEPELVDLTAAGVSIGISPGSSGLSLSVSGYPPNMQTVIKAALQAYNSFSGNNSDLNLIRRFKDAQAVYRERLKTYSDMPVSYAISDRTTLLQEGADSNEELLQALDNVTLQSALSTGKQVTLSKPLVLTSLSMGNLDQKMAEAAVTAVESGIPGAADGLKAAETSSGSVQRSLRVVNPANPAELRKKNPRAGDPNDAVVVSVLYGVSDIKNRVLFGILGDILKTVSYEELRTQRQLGYVVNGGALQLSNVLGVSCVVQGTKLKADPLEAAVEAVYHEYMPSKLAALADKDFQSYVSSYRQSLLTPPTSFQEEFAQFLDPVSSSTDSNCFHLHDEMLLFLDTLTSKQPLIDAWAALMQPSSGTRKKIVVKYFADTVPARPSISETKALWTREGVPTTSFELLQREYAATQMLEKADAATRAKLRQKGGLYSQELHCTLDQSLLESSSIRTGLRTVSMFFMLALALASWA